MDKEAHVMKKEISTLQAIGIIVGTVLGTAAIYLILIFTCALIA